MMRISILFLALIVSLIYADASDWLEGGYVGSPDYSEIRQYFTDPIFYTKVPVSQPLSFYRPYTGGFSYPLTAVQSDFRNRSLASMIWEPFEVNWTKTMFTAKSSSSLRVFKDGTWKSL
ncbi:hypothetical protein [Methanothrix sp.]|uniref:hypothetical protein n=1 Tax=Methanothrix sp. TaxID=90426 RepID=UPI003C74BFAB